MGSNPNATDGPYEPERIEPSDKALPQRPSGGARLAGEARRSFLGAIFGLGKSEDGDQ